jgi:hypothetical protein
MMASTDTLLPMFGLQPGQCKREGHTVLVAVPLRMITILETRCSDWELMQRQAIAVALDLAWSPCGRSDRGTSPPRPDKAQ